MQGLSEAGGMEINWDGKGEGKGWERRGRKERKKYCLFTDIRKFECYNISKTMFTDSSMLRS